MRKTHNILVWMSLVVLFSGPVSAAETTTSAQVSTMNATVGGTAFDNAGNPLGDVVVLVDGAAHQSQKTDARGKFLFKLPAGTYSIRATHPGFEAAAVTDIVLTANQVVDSFNVVLVPQTLQSLRVIGTVGTTATHSTFNTSGLSVSTLDGAKIAAREQPNLSKIVGELPGISASQNSGGQDPNTKWDIRGASIESRVAIDGHTVSSGVFGTYNTVYANSEIFEEVEVLKGAGLNGVDAGEAGFGTINLRTKSLTGKNSFTGSLSTDSYGSGHYNFSLEHQFFNNHLSVMVARSQQGYLGPDNNVPGPDQNTLGGTNLPSYTGGAALVQWQQPLSHPYVTLGDLVKARYKFSDVTWLTGEFLNLTGRYTAQGAAYAFDNGNFTIPQCANTVNKVTTFVPASGSGCTANSTYNNPQQFNLVGTQQQLYNYFPNSTVLNQEPQFSAEFRTALHGDTIFLRPYATEIKRTIDGSVEDLQPGNAGGWFQVVNPANCTVQFANPGSKSVIGGAGAAGPCFSAANGYTTPFVNNAGPTAPVFFQTTPVAPACSPATPCYTTVTQQQRNGVFAFGTPFSQPEFDRDDGVTFSWLHPVREDLYSFNVDYSRDFTTKLTSDTSQLPAGCFATVAGSPGQNTPTLSTGAPNPYYQPACNTGGVLFNPANPTLPRTAVQIPPTSNYKADLSLTALWQLNPKLQIGLGNYLTLERLDFQFTNPAAIVAAAGLKSSTGTSLNGAELADQTLIGGVATHAHYDPHLQAQYRVNSNLSLRATAGSSITTPFASLVSGFAKLTPNGGPTGNTDTITLPNTALQPEVTVAYDAGADLRLHDGTVLSSDVFDNNIHNVFVNISQVVPNLPGRPASITQTLQNETINGPQELDYGIEFTAQKNPSVGLGYYLTATAERAFYYGFSNGFYQGLTAVGNTSFTGLVNGLQLDGTGGFSDQIPYFKAKGELNYTFQHQKAYTALGVVLNGNNNPYGVPAFATMYVNGSYNINNLVSIGISAENLLQYSNGSFHGQVVNNAGFEPIGVSWSNLCSCLNNGPVHGTAFPFNNAVVVQPRTVYLTLTKRI